MLSSSLHLDDFWVTGLWFFRHSYSAQIQILLGVVVVNLKLGVQNSKLGVQNLKLGVQNSEVGVQNSKLGVRNSEVGVQNSEVGVQNSEVGVQNSKLDVQNSKLGIWNYCYWQIVLPNERDRTQYGLVKARDAINRRVYKGLRLKIHFISVNLPDLIDFTLVVSISTQLNIVTGFINRCLQNLGYLFRQCCIRF